MGNGIKTPKSKPSTDPKEDFIRELDNSLSEMKISDSSAPSMSVSQSGFSVENYVSDENNVMDIFDIFKYEKQLSASDSCRVLLAKHRQNKHRYALKEMSKKDAWNPYLFKKELCLLTILKHPNIISLYDVYVDDNSYFIATDYCSGGALLEKAAQFNNFSEGAAAQYIKNILHAIRFCHSKNIVHRNIRPGNVLFETNTVGSNLRLVGFADSEIVDDHKMYNEFVGNIHFLPPEITRSRHGWELKKGDIWAIGILAYLLLFGRPPFAGSTNKQILRRIEKGNIPWPNKVPVSPYAQNFIKSMLQLNPRARCSARRALKHSWFKKATLFPLSKPLIKNLNDIGQANLLQRIVINAIVSELTEADKGVLLRGFKSIDVDDKGYIDQKCIADYAKHLGCSNKQKCERRAKDIVQVFDHHQRANGRIHFGDQAYAVLSRQLTATATAAAEDGKESEALIPFATQNESHLMLSISDTPEITPPKILFDTNSVPSLQVRESLASDVPPMQRFLQSHIKE
jgi:hypothetical protein